MSAIAAVLAHIAWVISCAGAAQVNLRRMSLPDPSLETQARRKELQKLSSPTGAV